MSRSRTKQGPTLEFHANTGGTTNATRAIRLTMGLVVATLGITNMACQSATASREELLIVIDQAFEPWKERDQVVLVGSFTPTNIDSNLSATIWAFETSVPPKPTGKVVSRMKIPLDSLQGVLDAIQYRGTSPPEIEGDQCEFTEWKNENGVWRMRSAPTRAGHLIVLEVLNSTQKGD